MKPAPKAPSAKKTSAAQAQYNTQAAQQQQGLNAINQTGPFGATTFQRDAKGVPIGQTQTLNPQLAGTAGNVQGNLQSLSGLLPSTNFDSTNAAPDTNYLGQDFYNRGDELLQRSFDRDNKGFEVRMGERGLPIGSEAWGDAYGAHADSQNLARSQLAGQAIQLAPQEQQRLIQNARADYVQPYDVQRAGLSNLGLLGGLAPKAPTPQAGIAAPNHQQNVANQYNAEMQNYNSQMGGLGSLLGAAGSIAMAPVTGGGSLLGNYLMS